MNELLMEVLGAFVVALLLGIVLLAIRGRRKSRVTRRAETCLRRLFSEGPIEIGYQPNDDVLVFYVGPSMGSSQYFLTRQGDWVRRRAQPRQCQCLLRLMLGEIHAFAFKDLLRALTYLGTVKDFEREDFPAAGFWSVRPRQQA